MEQEPESPTFYDTVKRVGYTMRLAVHLLFIIVSFSGTAMLLAVLLFSR